MTQALATAPFIIAASITLPVLVDGLIKGRARWVYLKGKLA
jgi:hypothetical protein